MGISFARLNRRENRRSLAKEIALGALKIGRICGGAAKIAATAENRATCVHSVHMSCTGSRVMIRRQQKGDTVCTYSQSWQRYLHQYSHMGLHEISTLWFPSRYAKHASEENSKLNGVG